MYTETIIRPTTYTKKELDMILLLRKKPRKWDEVAAKLDLKVKKNSPALNIMFSDCSRLIKNEENEWWTEPLELNQLGETVAQAEHDRRFDMYFTRTLSLMALVVSVISLVLTVLC